MIRLGRKSKIKKKKREIQTRYVDCGFFLFFSPLKLPWMDENRLRKREVILQEKGEKEQRQVNTWLQIEG